MSLIADALKMAQREKQRREASDTPDISPVLVPLRTGSEASFSWRRAVTMGLSVMVTVAALGIMVKRMRKPKAPLAALPAITSPSPLARATDLPWSPPRQRTVSQTVVPRGSQVSSAPSRQPNVSRAGTVAPITSQARRDSQPKASLQSQPRTESIADSERPRRARDVQSAGRLKIAVEQPDNADPARLFAEALAAHRAGDLGRARFLYERVLVLTPNDADALNNLGVLLSTQRLYEPALDLLRRAASVAPKSAGTWNNIGSVLREQGHGSDAIAAFRHALSLDPQHQGAKIGLAQQYLASGSVKEARSLLEDVLSANPGVPEAHYALGQVFEMQGDRVSAIREYSEFVRRAPASLANYVERTRRHVDSLSTRTP